MIDRLLAVAADGSSARALDPVGVAAGARGEFWLRDFLFANPNALPASDFDPVFEKPIPICRELRTEGGRIDGLFANHHGALTLVECKLWRNPEARREVVTQILDYAKDLAAWQYEDLQSRVSQALSAPGRDMLFANVAAANPGLDEAQFIDRVARNLEEGRFLLVIVGDGIRQGTEALARFVTRHAGLRFTLGLVEMHAYAAPDGGLLVQPRVLARTVNLERFVGRVGMAAAAEFGDDAASPPAAASTSGDRSFSEPLKQADRAMWQAFKSSLRLDDPTVPPPTTGFGRAYLQLGTTAARLTVFAERSRNQIGGFVTFVGDEGRELYLQLQEDRESIDRELLEPLEPCSVEWGDNAGRLQVRVVQRSAGDWNPEHDASNLAWLLKAANVLVNVFRPRVAGPSRPDL